VTLMDLHVHSDCSDDGVSSITDYARRGAELGLSEVGFCEHVDLDPRDSGYGYLELERYDQEMAAARVQVPSVKLRQGIEIAYQAGREDEIRPWLKGHAWDYVVTSVHVVDYADGWAIVSEPQTSNAYFASHDQHQAYVPYFEELLRAVQSGFGDVLGHLDLVKRYGTAHYGPFDPFSYEDEVRSVLKAAIARGMGLEINTSGLRQSPDEPYPALPVLDWYRELGGEILTVGSDAHHSDSLGAAVHKALSLASEAGFKAVATFEARQPLWIDL
jgi:histidinol-phosphatase (PHP family)